ncbi:hypothetical protein HDU86_003476 [Geranomyces michiganensis]|nr:hypothetical protein HDU86_003476 [Geranomyces michiganensis]
MADAVSAPASASRTAKSTTPGTTTAERLNSLIDQFAHEAQALVVTYQKLLAHSATPAALDKQWAAVEHVATSLETTMAPKPGMSAPMSAVSASAALPSSASMLRPHVLKLGVVVARALENYRPPQPSAPKKPAKPDQEMMKSIMGLLTAVKDAVSVYVDAPEDTQSGVSAAQRKDAMPPSRSDGAKPGSGGLLPPPATHPAAPPRSSSQQLQQEQIEQRQALDAVAANLDAPTSSGPIAPPKGAVAPPIPPLFTKPVRAQHRGSKSEEGQAPAAAASAPAVRPIEEQKSTNAGPAISLQTALASAPSVQVAAPSSSAAAAVAPAQAGPAAAGGTVVAPLSDAGNFLKPDGDVVLVDASHPHSALTSAALRLSKRLSARIDRAMDAIRADEGHESGGDKSPPRSNTVDVKTQSLDELPEWRADETGNAEFGNAFAKAAVAASNLSDENLGSADSLADEQSLTADIPEWQADTTGNAEFDNAFTSAVLTAASLCDASNDDDRQLTGLSTTSLDELPEWQADENGNTEFNAAFAQVAIAAANLPEASPAGSSSNISDGESMDELPEWGADATGADEFDAAYAQAATAASELPSLEGESALSDDNFMQSQSEIPEWRADATGADEFDAAHAQAAVAASELPNLDIDYGLDAVSLESLSELPDWRADATGADEFDGAFARAAVVASEQPNRNIDYGMEAVSLESLTELPEWTADATGADEFDDAFAQAAVVASNLPNRSIDYGMEAVSLESLSDVPEWTADATGAEEFDNALALAAVAASNLPVEQTLLDSAESLEELPEWRGETGAPEFEAAYAEAAAAASDLPETVASDTGPMSPLAVDTAGQTVQVRLVTRPGADLIVPLSAVTAGPPAVSVPATVVVTHGRPQPAPQPSIRARAELFKGQAAPAPTPVRKQPIEIPRSSQPFKTAAATTTMTTANAATTGVGASNAPAIAANPALLRAQKQANRRSLLHVPSVRQATAFFEHTIDKVAESANALKRRPASPHQQQPVAGSRELSSDELPEPASARIGGGRSGRGLGSMASDLAATLGSLDRLQEDDGVAEEQNNDEQEEDDDEYESEDDSDGADSKPAAVPTLSSPPADTIARTGITRDDTDNITVPHPIAAVQEPGAVMTAAPHADKQIIPTIAHSPQVHTPSTAVERDNDDASTMESPTSLARHPSLRDVIQIAKDIIGDLNHHQQQQQLQPLPSQQEPTTVMRLAVVPQGDVTPATTTTIKFVTRDEDLHTPSAENAPRAPSPHRDLGDSGIESDASNVDERDESPEGAELGHESSSQQQTAASVITALPSQQQAHDQPALQRDADGQKSARTSTLPIYRDHEQQTSARASAVVVTPVATTKRDEAQQTSARASAISMTNRDEQQQQQLVDEQQLSRTSRALGAPAGREAVQRQSVGVSSQLPPNQRDNNDHEMLAPATELRPQQSQTIRVSVPPPARETQQQHGARISVRGSEQQTRASVPPPAHSAQDANAEHQGVRIPVFATDQNSRVSLLPTEQSATYAPKDQREEMSTHRASVQQPNVEQQHPVSHEDGMQQEATDEHIAVSRRSQPPHEEKKPPSSSRQSRVPPSAVIVGSARQSIPLPGRVELTQEERSRPQEAASSELNRLPQQPLVADDSHATDIPQSEQAATHEEGITRDASRAQEIQPALVNAPATRPKDPRLLHLTKNSPTFSDSNATLPDTDEQPAAQGSATASNAISPVPLSATTTIGAPTPTTAAGTTTPSSTTTAPTTTTTTQSPNPALRPLKLTLTPQNGQFTGFTVTLQSTLRLGRGAPREGFRGFQSQVVSRNHCDFLNARDGSGKVFLRDCGSNSGTFLNGERLSVVGVGSEPVEVKSGDFVQLGKDYEGSGGANVPEARRKGVKMIVKIEPMELPVGVSTPEIDAKVSSASLGGTAASQSSAPDLRGEYSASAESLTKSNLGAGDLSAKAGGTTSLDAVNVVKPAEAQGPNIPTSNSAQFVTAPAKPTAWPSTRPASKPQGWDDPDAAAAAAAAMAAPIPPQPAAAPRTRYTISVSGHKEKTRKIHVAGGDGSEGLTIGLKFWDTKRVVMIQDQRPQYASQNPGFEIFPDPRVMVDATTAPLTETPFVVTTATGAGMGKLLYISPLKLHIESAPVLSSPTSAMPTPAGLRAGMSTTPPPPVLPPPAATLQTAPPLNADPATAAAATTSTAAATTTAANANNPAGSTTQQQPGPSFTFTGELKDHKYIVVMRMPNSREQRVVGEAHGRSLAKKGVLDTRWVTSVEIEEGIYGQLFVAAMVFVALTAG